VGERKEESAPLWVNLAHVIHKGEGPTVRGTSQMSQVHISFSPQFKFLILVVHIFGA
jgi:hypothetical protein